MPFHAFGYIFFLYQLIALKGEGYIDTEATLRGLEKAAKKLGGMCFLYHLGALVAEYECPYCGLHNIIEWLDSVSNVTLLSKYLSKFSENFIIICYSWLTLKYLAISCIFTSLDSYINSLSSCY